METEKTKELLQHIEEVRRILNELSYEESFVVPQIVELSQNLDNLLNEYYRLSCRIS